MSLFLGGDSLETMFGHLFIFFYQSLSDDEILHSILSGIGEMLCSDHSMVFHRVTHLQGGVYKDAVVAVEHLRIHAAHGGADDEVWLFGGADTT